VLEHDLEVAQPSRRPNHAECRDQLFGVESLPSPYGTLRGYRSPKRSPLRQFRRFWGPAKQSHGLPLEFLRRDQESPLGMLLRSDCGPWRPIAFHRADRHVPVARIDQPPGAINSLCALPSAPGCSIPRARWARSRHIVEVPLQRITRHSENRRVMGVLLAGFVAPNFLRDLSHAQPLTTQVRCPAHYTHVKKKIHIHIGLRCLNFVTTPHPKNPHHPCRPARQRFGFAILGNNANKPLIGFVRPKMRI